MLKTRFQFLLLVLLIVFAIVLLAGAVFAFVMLVLSGQESGDACWQQPQTVENVRQHYSMMEASGKTMPLTLEESIRILHEQHKKDRYKGAIRLWRNDVYYGIAGVRFTKAEKQVIHTAFKWWEDRTCITFKYMDRNGRAHLKYLGDTYLLATKERYWSNNRIKFIETKCASPLGLRDKGEDFQRIFLGQTCLSSSYGIAAHEIGHALGLTHEHQRLDRDQYVTIKLENSWEEIHFDFQWAIVTKYQQNETLNDYGLQYDFGSVMQYSSVSWSKDLCSPLYTVEPHDLRMTKTMGQGSELSFNDVRSINAAYCSDICDTNL